MMAVEKLSVLATENDAHKKGQVSIYGKLNDDCSRGRTKVEDGGEVMTTVVQEEASLEARLIMIEDFRTVQWAASASCSWVGREVRCTESGGKAR
jgi:hypothetical protein